MQANSFVKHIFDDKNVPVFLLSSSYSSTFKCLKINYSDLWFTIMKVPFNINYCVQSGTKIPDTCIIIVTD